MAAGRYGDNVTGRIGQQQSNDENDRSRRRNRSIVAQRRRSNRKKNILSDDKQNKTKRKVNVASSYLDRIRGGDRPPTHRHLQNTKIVSVTIGFIIECFLVSVTQFRGCGPSEMNRHFSSIAHIFFMIFYDQHLLRTSRVFLIAADRQADDIDHFGGRNLILWLPSRRTVRWETTPLISIDSARWHYNQTTESPATGSHPKGRIRSHTNFFLLSRVDRIPH
jgi:hypothetical protein